MIIGITGKKQSGKDTMANYLVKEYGFIKYSMAGPLKEGCKKLFGLTEEQVNGDFKETIDKRWGVTPRKILQVMGTEIFQYDLLERIPEFKSIGRRFWVLRFKQFCDDNPYANIVISDIRFLHESQAISQLCGKMVRIVRPSAFSTDLHPSEMEQEKIQTCFTFVNDGTFKDYYKLIDHFMKNGAFNGF